MRCLVTGATGFVGRTLSAHLADAGYGISLTSRHGGSLQDGSSVKAADLATTDITDLIEGVDAVFHLAGIAHQQASEADYQRVNVDASCRLATAALAAGVKTFVFMSSTRAEPRELFGPDYYGRSKLAAEKALGALASGSSMRLVIVRPALVYGPGVKGNLERLARAMISGLPLPPAHGARSMIGAADLSRLLIHVLASVGRDTDVLTVTDGERYSTQRIALALRLAANRRGNGLVVPQWCWQLGSRLLDLRSGAAAGLHYDKLFGDDLVAGNAHRSVPDWKPEQVFEDLAAEVVAAVRQAPVSTP